jgi:hypothetical protein
MISFLPEAQIVDFTSTLAHEGTLDIRWNLILTADNQYPNVTRIGF